MQYYWFYPLFLVHECLQKKQMNNNFMYLK